jgi:uncharacterized protein (DUF169 family)
MQTLTKSVNGGKAMSNWKEYAGILESSLRLRTHPIAYKRFEKAGDLDRISGLQRINRPFTFCQLPTLVRRGHDVAIGVTRGDQINPRCARIHGLAPTTEKQLAGEIVYFKNTYFTTEEEAKRQMASYPLIPAGEAIVLAPLDSIQFEPDVILIYATPAQMMVLLCALQVKDFERFHFFFIGEGSCADSLAQCYVTGKPALSLPCYGERSFGAVEDDELLLAIPPAMKEKAIDGLATLEKRHRGYPIPVLGPAAPPPSLIQPT